MPCSLSITASHTFILQAAFADMCFGHFSHVHNLGSGALMSTKLQGSEATTDGGPGNKNSNTPTRSVTITQPCVRKSFFPISAWYSMTNQTMKGVYNVRMIPERYANQVPTYKRCHHLVRLHKWPTNTRSWESERVMWDCDRFLHLKWWSGCADKWKRKDNRQVGVHTWFTVKGKFGSLKRKGVMQ